MKPIFSIVYLRHDEQTKTKVEAANDHRPIHTAMNAADAKPNTPSFLTAATTTKANAAAEECDAEVWEIFNSGFSQVQAVLDRNRVLIRQVNENHQSKIPDNMVKNVALIQELNANVTMVVSLYSDLSTNFSSAFHLRSRTSRAVDGGVGIPDPPAEGAVAPESTKPVRSIF